MEKVTINNEVVFMRKFVKQAKIRAINGYTKEIRKLQNRKGSDEATAKFKRKAERLLAKVAILRKIQPDAVSRKALAKEKDWKTVLKEKNIPLEDQCYALLANYSAVQTEVERFHKKYWDLVPKIPTFFKDWEEKNKDPMSKQDLSESDKDINEANKYEPLPTTNSSKGSGDIRTRLQALAENKLKSDIKRKKQKKNSSNKPVQVNKQKAVAMVNLNELLGLDEFPVEKANDAAEETVENKRKKDPFFLGKDGEVISESEDEDSPNSFPGKDSPAFKKKKFDAFSKHSKGDLFKRRSFSDSSMPGFKGRDFPRDQRNSEYKNPSFKSKERQSLNGKEFSRKQNSSNFEDGNNSFKNRQQRRFQQNKSFGEKIPPKQFKSDPYVAPRNKDNFVKNKMNNPPNKSLVDDKPLHPSWEAKKKLKEAAASKFQGKRIVFDD